MEPIRKILAIAFVVTGITGGAVFMHLAMQEPRSLPQHATVLRDPVTLPQFSLSDHNGAPFGNESLRGRWSLMFFGFSNCPDICPATLTQLAIARNRVLHANGGEFPEIILVSVDPQRDSPEVMAAYVANFGEGITGVTGALEEIRKLTATLGVYFHRTAGGDGHQSVEHSAAVMLINKSGDMSALFGAPHAIDDFVNDVPLIMEST